MEQRSNGAPRFDAWACEAGPPRGAVTRRASNRSASPCASAFLGDALSSPFGLRFSVAPFVKPLPPSPSVARLRLIAGESELEPRRVTFHRLVRIGPRQRIAEHPGGVARPVRIEEMRAREHAQVRTTGGDDRVHIHVRRDVTHRHRLHADVVADSIREWRPEETTVDTLLVRDRLSGRHVDDVAAVRLHHSCYFHRSVRLHAAWSLIQGADVAALRLLVRLPLTPCNFHVLRHRVMGIYRPT